MKIYYSPYFNGKAYLDYNLRNEHNGLLGECVESTPGLLRRLELMLGLSYPETSDSSETLRAASYYEVLRISLEKNNDSILSDSFELDRKEKEQLEGSSKEPNYRVTKEILSWRDSLILAGWDMKQPLPGKLELISRSEKFVEQYHGMKLGEADRWFEVARRCKDLKGKVEIALCCRAELVPSLIKNVIDELDCSFKAQAYNNPAAKSQNLSVIEFKELTDTYEWLATQAPKEGQVVVCGETENLDCVLRCFHKPMVGEKAQVGCHHVLSSVLDCIDMPKSLIWLDCNGDYDLFYQYYFLCESEINALAPLGIKIPLKETMIAALRDQIDALVNALPEVTLVKAKYDKGSALSEHPVISARVSTKDDDGKIKISEGKIEVNLKDEEVEKRFVKKTEYQLGTDAWTGTHLISYSSLSNLIQSPFDFVVEKEAGMLEQRIDDLHTTEGTVAHKVIELLCESTRDQNEFKTFDAAFKEAVSTVGGDLKKVENQIELESFKIILQHSVDTLFKIMVEEELEYVKSEMKIEGKLDTFEQSIGFIDLVLRKKDKNNEYVIIDLKYSSSDKGYPEKLKKNTSIQAMIYKELFDNISSDSNEGINKKLNQEIIEKYKLPKDCTAVAFGYYLIPLETLYVQNGPYGSDNLLMKSQKIKVVNNENEQFDTLAAMKASFIIRKTQLKNKIVEEGETLDITETEYYKSIGNNNLFPLDLKSKGVKAAPYSNSHIVLKNQIR